MTNLLPDLSIVIPLKDEAATVAPLLGELCPILKGLGSHEILAIDDGSTDGTWQALGEARAKHGEALRPVRFERNCGQSAAFWAGLKQARGRIVVMMDGDMQNDPHDIPRLLAEIEKGADVCLTWREKRRDSAFKRFQSRVGNGFRNWMLGSDVRDTGSQLRAFRRELIENLPPFNGMHRFMGNLFLMQGCRIAQISTNHRSRQAGETKYGMGNRLWRGLRDVMGVRWLSKRAIRYRIAEQDDESI